jgi:hypothetical protein
MSCVGRQNPAYSSISSTLARSPPANARRTHTRRVALAYTTLSTSTPLPLHVSPTVSLAISLTDSPSPPPTRTPRSDKTGRS